MQQQQGVEFTLKEECFIRQAGYERWSANKGTPDIKAYDKKRFRLTSLQANVLGVAAEAAWFKYLGGDVVNHTLEEWAHFVPPDHEDYKRLLKRQDLFDTYEVRRADKRGNPIPVRRKDALIVLQAYVNYSYSGWAVAFGPVELTGWCYTSDEGTTPPWSATAKVVTNKRPVEDLPSSPATVGAGIDEFNW